MTLIEFLSISSLNNNLQEINLSGSNIGNLDLIRFQDICIAISQNYGLHILDLSSNMLMNLTEEKLDCLDEALKNCPALHTFNIGDNDLGTLNVSSIQNLGKKLLLSSRSVLQVINLYSNRLDSLDKSGIEALGNVLKQCRCLHTLDLKYNNLGTLSVDNFRVLLDILLQCPSLHTLDLRNNQFNVEQRQELEQHLILRHHNILLNDDVDKDNNSIVISSDQLNSSTAKPRPS